jgi:hypothetical protein
MDKNVYNFRPSTFDPRPRRTTLDNYTNSNYKRQLHLGNEFHSLAPSQQKLFLMSRNKRDLKKLYKFFQIRESNFYIHVFPFTGRFLEPIMEGGGGYIHIFMLATVKTIAFKRNPSGRTRIYMNTPPPPIIELGTALSL